ncbi:MAG: hypothetical protein ABIS06_11695 [Vicinamibacterales bacterium]
MVHPEKPKGKGRTRILYWFRTPPGVKVGRSALDEDAIRLIEQHNPEISFDWTRILKGQPDEPEVERRPPPPRPPSVRQERPERQERSAAPPRPPVPEFVPPVDDGPPTPAHAKLGSEGVLRLRGRYAEMVARIHERVPEPERQTELKSIAERLNPDAWVTDADVLAGLDSYETSFESLRSVVGRRRRRQDKGPAE